ncbi:MAG: cysteine hydrolase [Acidobacteria bacterium]|nr:cysteine hydrolase [Acidobacteriota bacterium]
MATVFFDVDTQLDFLYPSGALYVPGAESIVPAVARLNQHAASRGIPLISTVDAHSENDPEFRSWPPHCVTHTLGQRKPAVTLPPADARHLVIEKQHVDCFTSPALEPALASLGATHAVVYGVVTEICVHNAIVGLQARGLRVDVVAEAVRHLAEPAARATLERVTDRGGRLLTTAEALAL